VQVVPDKPLLRLAATRPDLVLELGLRMSQEMKQQLGQLEALQQVGCVAHGCGGATAAQPQCQEALGDWGSCQHSLCD
jgi:hypothetical protein